MDFNVGTIEREYELKRSNALTQSALHAQSIYNDFPEIGEIEHEIRKLGIEAAKLSLVIDDDQNRTKIATILEKINELKAKKESLLEKNNVSLAPKYECDKCKDTGYITINMRTEMCTCMKQKLLDNYYNRFNLSYLKLQNFERFDESLYSDKADFEKYHSKNSPRENIIKIKNLANKFIEEFNNPEAKNLLFTGTAGVGKTFISGCIANELLQNGHTVLYETAPQLLDDIFEYKYGSKSKNLKDLYDSIFNVDLLIIDDLGTENQTSAKFTELFTIINTRILNPNTKTIISTNHDLKQLSKLYDDRILSRLIGHYVICRFFGDDIRLLKNKK